MFYAFVSICLIAILSVLITVWLKIKKLARDVEKTWKLAGDTWCKVQIIEMILTLDKTKTALVPDKDS